MPGGRPGRANLRTLQVIQSLERAGFLRKVAAAPDINGRPPLRWDVHPVLIGVVDCTPWVRQQNNGQWVDH
jgi:hypothetical protein